MSGFRAMPLQILILLAIVPAALCSERVFPSRRAINRSARRCTSQPELVCTFRPTEGHKVHGIVSFKSVFRPKRALQSRCRVRVVGTLRGLSPGLHGFHIHTFGDQRQTDGSSTGGHFTNPGGAETRHGLPGDGARHWGDFGNLFAKKDGIARYMRYDRMISLEGILGRGMIIHELKDLGSSEQPTGAAGGRQSSCVIGFKNPDV